MVFLGASVFRYKSLPIGRYSPLGDVGVIGLGTMGGEIAAYLARRGGYVYGVDIASKARQRAAKQGLRGIYARIDDLPVKLDAVIEAVPEDTALKGSILERVNGHVSNDTYLATISSTIPCSTYTDKVSHPERLMNAHILPDLRTRRFVELQGPGQYTKRENLEAMAHAFKDKGFAAATMFDLMRQYSPVTIEYSCRDYFDMPYGGVMAMDLIGYDTLYQIFGRVEETMGIPVPEVVVEMNRKETYGLKSGKGFFEYDRSDLEGFHKTAKEFPELYPGSADEAVGERIWNVIRQGAKRLVEHGQDKDDVSTAVRYGFPIERKSLLMELDELIETGRDRRCCAAACDFSLGVFGSFLV